ncbi:MAG: hypothetical protein IJ532_04655 [Alphaproteobacteria bacterium]|nr:hypothetical protein [Alphaproteobacteria bacterium]
MTTESLLVKTKDNYVVVLTINYANDAEKLRLTGQCENYCRSVNFNDVDTQRLSSSNITYDSVNTEFLKSEIAGYHYQKQPENFVNEMKDNNFPAKVMKPNVLHFDSRLPDSFFPPMIKNTGYKVVPEDEFYKVRYNSFKGKYEIVNPKIRRAQVDYNKKELSIVRNHFEFAPKDYAKLQTMIADYNAKKQNNPKLSLLDYARSINNTKDLSLFTIYAREQENVNHLNATISHELKHIKNMIFTDGLGLKKDYRLMSVDNMYRICVENERSSYLDQLVFCLNKYLKNGDYNDFSMFDGESQACANHLKTLQTKEERIAYATNWPLLVEKMLKQFNSSHKAYYDKNQFKGNLKSYAQTEPMSALPDDNAETFKKIRSLYYHYMIYNPATGREESVNLAKYITPDLEVGISSDNRRKIIAPAEEILRERRKDFNNKLNAGEINIDLVGPAKALMRGNLKSDSFINEVDSINVGILVEEENKPEGNNNHPALPSVPSIPDDKAYWSDGLQRYWSKFEGYREIAKNNIEYTFKINDTKLKYTDKNHVNVSSNADFELYVKLLKEPSGKNNVIEFAPTLSKEQALMLYIACTNYGRRMSGKVPTDLSSIERLQGIPAAEMNKFNHRTGRGGQSQQVAQSILTPRVQRGLNRAG